MPVLQRSCVVLDQLTSDQHAPYLRPAHKKERGSSSAVRGARVSGQQAATSRIQEGPGGMHLQHVMPRVPYVLNTQQTVGILWLMKLL